jgi:hypothetical protein
MAMSYKVLGQSCPANTANVTLYTVPVNANAIISTISICNLSSNNKTYNIAVVPSTQTIGLKNMISSNSVVGAYDSIAMTMGMTLGANDSVIIAAQDQNNIAFTIFGTEIS